MAIERWGCIWKVTYFIADDPELFYKKRVHLECTESNNECFPVGSTMTFGIGDNDTLE